jgi:4-amino-4-deoxy-L-arabinose transferase-like glycosyltransferase
MSVSTDASRRRAPRGLFPVLVFVTALAGVFENTYHLSVGSALADEHTYAVAGWRLIHGKVGPTPATTATVAANLEHPPLAKYLFGLAQVIAGHAYDLDADRAVSVICTLGTALIMGLLVARIVGRWSGLLTSALVLLLPETVSPQLTRYGRNGMLDPVSELFMVASVALAWLWLTSSGRRSVGWAIGLGLVTGLASSAKENGFLGVVGPVALGVLLAGLSGGFRAAGWRAMQASLAAVLAVAVFLATYLPLGHVLARVHYLIRFQSVQSKAGHLINVDGRVYLHPPWWANFYYAGQGVGVVTSVALVVAAIAAVVLVRTPAMLLMVTALVGPVVFHCVLAGVTLPYYWTLWEPAFLALAAMGITGLFARAVRPRSSHSARPARDGAHVVGTSRMGRAMRPGARSVLWLVPAVVLAVIPAVSAARELRTTATVRPFGPDALPALFARDHVSGPVGLTGLSESQLVYYVDLARISMTVTAASANWQAVIVSQPGCRVSIDPGVRALVATNEANGRLRLVHSDRMLMVYLASGRLQIPTPAQVAVQPPASLTAGCKSSSTSG